MPSTCHAARPDDRQSQQQQAEEKQRGTRSDREAASLHNLVPDTITPLRKRLNAMLKRISVQGRQRKCCLSVITLSAQKELRLCPRTGLSPLRFQERNQDLIPMLPLAHQSLLVAAQQIKLRLVAAPPQALTALRVACGVATFFLLDHAAVNLLLQTPCGHECIGTNRCKCMPPTAVPDLHGRKP
jgi:hypothetical protein